MPLLLAILGGAVSSQVVGAVVARLAIAIGISVVTYVGISVGFNAIWSAVNTNLGGIGATAINFLDMCGVRHALSVIASAYMSALALKGLSASGAIKKLTWGAPGSVLGGQ